MDKTLLDKDGTPTIDELKDFFKSNDYSTAVSSFDHEKADDKTNQTYLRAKKMFSKFITGKKRKNKSNLVPSWARCNQHYYNSRKVERG